MNAVTCRVELVQLITLE